MRRIAAALALIIAPLLSAVPAPPAHAQAVPGTLLSISPRGTQRWVSANLYAVHR